MSRRTTIGLVSTGGLTVAAAGLAWWGNDAERRFREAQREAAEAVERAIDKEAMRTEIQGQLLAFAAARTSMPWTGRKAATLRIHKR